LVFVSPSDRFTRRAQSIGDALLLRGSTDNLASYGIPFMAVRFPAVNNICRAAGHGEIGMVAIQESMPSMTLYALMTA
jgi:hypothetical protein